MRLRTTVSAILACLFLAVPVFAADPPTEVVGSLSWNDSTESLYRSITAGFNLTFPVGKHFAIGPVFQYDYLRGAETETTVVLEGGDQASESAEPHSETVTVSESGGTVSVWSFGGRGAFHFNDTHNGVYLAAEAMLPQADAEGYIVTPEVGIQFSLGGALARVAYRRPYHRDPGDFVDLGSQQLAFSFGGRF